MLDQFGKHGAAGVHTALLPLSLLPKNDRLSSPSTQYAPVEVVLFRNGSEKMRRYHHIGIPTSQPRPGERDIERLKIFIVGHENSEYGVEWMRFEADAPIPELVRQVPHVAFEVS